MAEQRTPSPFHVIEHELADAWDRSPIGRLLAWYRRVARAFGLMMFAVSVLSVATALTIVGAIR